MTRSLPQASAILGLVLTLSVLACDTNSSNGRNDGITTVILVRHAEKDSVGDDPELTAAGEERALALAHVVGEANVRAVYATEFARTRNTALPLANLLGLEVVAFAPSESYVTDMAELVLGRHRGDVVVIVSHSNTVPAIIGELGGYPVPVIDDDEYDDLYVVTIAPGGQVSLLPLRYGRETA
jgi:broad specificity phosphatase PhoE